LTDVEEADGCVVGAQGWEAVGMFASAGVCLEKRVLHALDLYTR